MRRGAILPLQPELPTSAHGPKDNLTLRVWTGADGASRLYEDEGRGFGYRDPRALLNDPSAICVRTLESCRPRFPCAGIRMVIRSGQARPRDPVAVRWLTRSNDDLPSHPWNPTHTQRTSTIQPPRLLSRLSSCPPPRSGKGSLLLAAFGLF
jgi:hypothetical protein